MTPADVDSQYQEAAAAAETYLALQPGSAAPVELRDRLYETWYAALRDAKPLSVGALPFVAQLRVAHAGSRRWQDGWVALRVSTAGRVLAGRRGVQRLLWPGDYANRDQPGLVPWPGTPLTVVDRLDSVELLPGYWVTHSADWFPLSGTATRIYWNLQPAGAADLVRTLTELLPPHAFCLKVPSDPIAFARPDAGVLYVRADAEGAVWRSIRRAHDAVATWLAPGVPPLTKRLEAGLAAAELPFDATESFGQHRCRLIAEAVIWARRERQDPIGAIRQRFAEAGIDPDRPWTLARSARVPAGS